MTVARAGCSGCSVAAGSGRRGVASASRSPEIGHEMCLASQDAFRAGSPPPCSQNHTSCTVPPRIWHAHMAFLPTTSPLGSWGPVCKRMASSYSNPTFSSLWSAAAGPVVPRFSFFARRLAERSAASKASSSTSMLSLAMSLARCGRGQDNRAANQYSLYTASPYDET